MSLLLLIVIAWSLAATWSALIYYRANKLGQRAPRCGFPGRATSERCARHRQVTRRAILTKLNRRILK